MQCRVWVVIFCALVNSVSCCLRYKSNNLFKYPHVGALVLARGGSKEIKLKNLQIVGNKTLIGRSLEKIKKVNFDSIWVSTEHFLIAEEAEKFNVNIHWRAPDTATDEASSVYATQEFLKYHPEVDIVALIQCTSPFIKKEYLEKAIDLIRSHKCVFSVSRSFKLIWEITNGKLKPLNFNLEKRPRRQDLAEQLAENGMFYFSSRKFVTNGYFQSSGWIKSKVLCSWWEPKPEVFRWTKFSDCIRLNKSCQLSCGFVEIPKYTDIEVDSPLDLIVANMISQLEL